jgi:Zn finger protein HypA/HybF involved in hydrogenase expression
MHEFGIVADMINSLVGELDRQQITSVKSVHMRRGIDFYEESLRQAYSMYTQGTLLEHSELIVDSAAVPYRCTCGAAGTVTADELQGAMIVCPTCSAVIPLEGVPDLQVVEVVAEKG